MATTLAKSTAEPIKGVSVEEAIALDGIPPLGGPEEEKRFFWQRRKAYDPYATATQPSVFDDSEMAEKYEPRPDWENLHRFDPMARWTWEEEYSVVRKIDVRIMIWTCIMFGALELDRGNLSQALTDNFLKDLNLGTNDYNMGNTVFHICFLLSEIPSQLVSKWIGPDRWIPTQLTLWSIVAGAQFWLKGRSSFLACRALLGILQGGFIPDVVLYLSYFYKHHELAIRFSWFWAMSVVADIIASFLAFGILHMSGVAGYAGWRWLFLLEGILTLLIGLGSYILMPPGPCQTANWSRGKNGWFSPREETIMVNRVLREDPSKSQMHNRQAITPKLLWKSLCDYDLWPLYAIGLLFEVPTRPVGQYLTLSLKGLGFNKFQTNLLTIPSNVLGIITMLLLTYLSEVWKELTFMAMFCQIWVLPFLVWLETAYTAESNRWLVFAIMTLLLGGPLAHPLQVAWNSRNSNTIRSRTVSAATYNMFVQLSSIIGSNIYLSDDKPLYRRGNKVLLGILALNVFLYAFTKAYYIWRNKTRDRKWNAMNEQERVNYLATTTDEGNKRLDFRFAH